MLAAEKRRISEYTRTTAEKINEECCQVNMLSVKGRNMM